MEESSVRSAFGNIQKGGNLLDDLAAGLKAMSNGGPFLDDVAAISIQRCGDDRKSGVPDECIYAFRRLEKHPDLQILRQEP